MSRLARLRAIRTVQLHHGLRRLAGTERRCADLGDMQARLLALRDEAFPAVATPARKAAAAAQLRLVEAAAQLDAAQTAAQRERAAAAGAAAALRVRVDVVDRALAART